MDDGTEAADKAPQVCTVRPRHPPLKPGKISLSPDQSFQQEAAHLAPRWTRCTCKVCRAETARSPVIGLPPVSPPQVPNTASLRLAPREKLDAVSLRCLAPPGRMRELCCSVAPHVQRRPVHFTVAAEHLRRLEQFCEHLRRATAAISLPISTSTRSMVYRFAANLHPRPTRRGRFSPSPAAGRDAG